MKKPTQLDELLQRKAGQQSPVEQRVRRGRRVQFIGDFIWYGFWAFLVIMSVYEDFYHNKHVCTTSGTTQTCVTSVVNQWHW